MDLHSVEDEQSSISRSLQVITSVNCVIRELVENSIDAGSTKIEIKVYNGGVDLIQVSDNGSGILESNFEILASKHTTSKIRQFEDLFSSLTTFGFRGEALYSLCNVGTVEIETRVKPNEHGWLLKYNSAGELTSKMAFGTCVRVKDLFKCYSVRRKLLASSSKTQVSKAVSQLQQYALINPNIAFTFTTVTNANQYSNIFTTTGTNTTVKEVVQQIFGHDFMSKLIDIRIADNTWKIEGLISSPYIERGSRDLEYFYINRRPITKIQKFKNAIAWVFKHFSSKAKPSFILNLTIDYDNVDINLSPDKRSAFLFSEDYIVKSFRDALYDILIPKNSNLSQINSEILTQFLANPDGRGVVKQEEAAARPPEPESAPPNVLREMAQPEARKPEPAPQRRAHAPPSMDDPIERYALNEDDDDEPDEAQKGLSLSLGDLASVKEDPDLEEYPAGAKRERDLELEDASSPKRVLAEMHEDTQPTVLATSGAVTRETTADAAEEQHAPPRLPATYTLQDFLDNCPNQEDTGESEFLEITERGLYANIRPILYQAGPHEQLDTTDLSANDMEDHNFLDPKVFENMKLVGQFNNSFIITKLTFPEVKSRFNFSIYIIDQHAADEKYRWARHTRRFENLNKTVKIDKQVMINPKRVELSPFLTQVAEQHLDLLIANGFDTTVCKDSEVVMYRDQELTMSTDSAHHMSKGVYLHSFPQVLGKVLEEEDFVEFVNQLSGAEQMDNRDERDVVWGRGAIQRPQRVWSIMANRWAADTRRACKTAIKLGDPLTRGQMKKLIDNLATLVHPWNCPHGRPSMKCLISHQQLDAVFSAA